MDRMIQPEDFTKVSINSTSYKRSDCQFKLIRNTWRCCEKFPLIPLLIKEAMIGQATNLVLSDDSKVSINSTSYKRSDDPSNFTGNFLMSFPLIPLLIKEAIIKTDCSKFPSESVSINSTSYKRSDSNNSFPAATNLQTFPLIPLLIKEAISSHRRSTRKIFSYRFH